MSDPAHDEAWEEFKSANEDDDAWERLLADALELPDDNEPGCSDGLHDMREIKIHIDMCDRCGHWWHRTD